MSSSQNVLEILNGAYDGMDRRKRLFLNQLIPLEQMGRLQQISLDQAQFCVKIVKYSLEYYKLLKHLRQLIVDNTGVY